MSTYSASDSPGPARVIRAGVLWAGGGAAALVAALAAAVGYLAVRGLFDLPILGVADDEGLVQPSVGAYMLAAAFAALAATAVMHILLAVAPQPRVFFGWIIGLATVLAALYPLVMPGVTQAAVATAIVNIVIGVAIGTLVSMSARSATTPPRLVRAPTQQYR